MNRVASTITILAALVAAGTGGYWAARHGLSVPLPVFAKPPAPTGPVIYYQDPDGKPFYSAKPKQTSDGRPYRAVHASEDISFDEQKPETASASSEKKILYYRNPMGLPDVSKTPKKDSMGMDYIPVHEGEDTDSSTVKVSAGKLQRIGVKSEPATLRAIAVPVRAPGTIQLDERRISVISLRSAPFVDPVENVTTGGEVSKGQPLMRVYSPVIAAAAAEYAATLGSKGEPTGPQGSRHRLLNLSASPELVDEIQRTRQVPITFTWTSPRDGIVLERNVSDGMRVVPGDVLFRVADHSVVWAAVDVAERDLAAVGEGQPVTVRVGIELPNADHLLLPDMYAEAEIDTGSAEKVVAVPDSAVIDSGDRQIVIVDKGEGRFEPRKVQFGRRGAGYVEIKNGVGEGEAVVTSANFLIDAES